MVGMMGSAGLGIRHLDFNSKPWVGLRTRAFRDVDAGVGAGSGRLGARRW